MPKPRKQMDAKGKAQFEAKKKFVRYKEGAMLYQAKNIVRYIQR